MSVLNILRTRFFIKKDKARQNLAPLYVRITLHGQSLDVSLRRSIDIEKWDTDLGRAKGKREDVRIVNDYLDNVRAELNQCCTELKLQRKPVTLEAVKDLFCGIVPLGHTLLGLMEYHNNSLKHTLEWGTMKNYVTTQSYVKLFLERKLKRADIPLNELTYPFIIDFQVFMLNHRPTDYHIPCGHNTVLKHIERLRKMIAVGIRNEWMEKDPFAKFQARFIRKERQCLDSAELAAIEQKDFQVPRLNWARDLFVFSCYTGLAYCDLMNLKPEHISLGMDRGQWIMTARKKTNQPLRIPLLPKAQVIIQKYQGDPRAAFTGTVFAALSNQKLNSYLKEIADLCGIKKNLTFHLARHTFATTVTLTNGVPIETVSKMLGHASIRTTQIYAKVVEKKVSQDMGALRAVLAEQSKREDTPLRAIVGNN
ncbi:site-specific integrase [Parachryseolinea silvisoli]|uniref:site-specific integrase n=1 Tax=Parachryseolinea silvisoli TaxID=2873601 RepID=UPI002265B4E2|nr:site-specific integrase [Parachryseolinea silvisoli]MCD9017501.1 site-specific integrase [Parachryseolinea silvisoli]